MVTSPPPIFPFGATFCKGSLGGCGVDAYVAKLNPAGSAVTLFTYLGGAEGFDEGFGIVAKGSSVYVSGYTTSFDFPTSPGAFLESPREDANAWITKVGVAPLFISPPNASVQPGGTAQFTATGGIGFGYVFSLTANGSGGSVTSDGDYAAGITGGTTDTVTVTDAAGFTASAVVSIGGNTTDLIISPASTSVTPKGTRIFQASGGVPPYVFSFASNASVGTVASNGNYTAGTKGGVTDIVRVTDAIGESKTATVAVGAGITITPPSPKTPPGGTVDFIATGGSGTGYSWSIASKSPSGTISATSGRYTAGSSSNVVETVKVTDSLGNTATVQVSVGGGLAIDPDAPSTTTKGTVQFTAFGGSGVYTWSFIENASGGTIDPATGAYQAGTTGNVQDVIKVTDSLGKAAAATVDVGPALSITPTSAQALAETHVQFTAAGGSGTGYAYSITQNQSGGTVGNDGVYTAGDNGGTDTVQLTDSAGNTATAQVTVTPKPKANNGGGGADGGAGNGNNNDAGQNGLNLAGGGNDDCNCHTAGASSLSAGASAARVFAGLALVLGLVLRRRRRQ
jgi:hypothetical protein